VLERFGGPLNAPQENLTIGVSKTQTYPGRGPDISGQPLWKSAWGLDMSDLGLSH
jgi:hypothetical protein